MRIGSGYDVHVFAADRKLILGGVEINWTHGLEGHSDADVLLHAICDACLGAAAMGDIGTYFSPDDQQFKDLDSRVMLRKVISMLLESGWVVSNIDCTIIAEKPRLSPHILAMRENISSDASISLDQVNVKATTTEGLGFIGKQLGIAAQAIVLIDNHST